MRPTPGPWPALIVLIGTAAGSVASVQPIGAEGARGAGTSSVSTAIAPWRQPPRSWEAMLAPLEESGGRFVMEGRVLGARDSIPLSGITLYVYHADGRGEYGEPYPRLAGVLKTDSLGRYRVSSVLPGQYEGPPHIHFEAWGSHLPVRTWFVNLYMGPGEKPDSSWGHMVVSRRRALDPGRPETFVTRDAQGVFHARYDLHWDRAFTPPAELDSMRRGSGG